MLRPPPPPALALPTDFHSMLGDEKSRAMLGLAAKFGLKSQDLASWSALVIQNQSSFLDAVMRTLGSKEANNLFENYIDIDNSFIVAKSFRDSAVFSLGNTWVLHHEASEADEPFEIIELRGGSFSHASMYLLTTHPLAFASLSGAISLVASDGAIAVLNEGDDGWSGAEFEPES